MRLKEQKKYSVDFLFTMLTFALYAGMMIVLVYMGAQVYQSVIVRMKNQDATRTAQAYIVEKVRQSDAAGSIHTEKIQGIDVLVLKQFMGGKEYATYIYTQEGMLKELFTRVDRKVVLSDGTGILDLSGFSIEEEEGGLLKGAITDNRGFTRTFWIYRECEGAKGA